MSETRTFHITGDRKRTADRLSSVLNSNRRWVLAAGTAAVLLLAGTWFVMEYGMGFSHLASTVNARVNVEPTSGKVYAVAYFEDQRSGKVNVGQPATVEIDLLADHTFHGHVVEVSEMPSAARSLISGQDNISVGQMKTVVAVKIAFDEAVDSVALLPSASVLLTIDTEEKLEGFATYISHRCACLCRPPIDGLKATNLMD